MKKVLVVLCAALCALSSGSFVYTQSYRAIQFLGDDNVWHTEPEVDGSGLMETYALGTFNRVKNLDNGNEDTFGGLGEVAVASSLSSNEVASFLHGWYMMGHAPDQYYRRALHVTQFTVDADGSFLLAYKRREVRTAAHLYERRPDGVTVDLLAESLGTVRLHSTSTYELSQYVNTYRYEYWDEFSEVRITPVPETTTPVIAGFLWMATRRARRNCRTAESCEPTATRTT